MRHQRRRGIIFLVGGQVENRLAEFGRKVDGAAPAPSLASTPKPGNGWPSVKGVYGDNCAACHGADLEGPARPLTRTAGNLNRHLVPDGIAMLSGLLARDGRQGIAAHR